MPKFRTSPSRRRAPSPVAKWLIVGYDTSREIMYKGRTAYIQPVRSSDHRKRYTAGRQLAVKAFVGGPTECRINVLRVDRVQVADVDFETARALGYVRVDTFRETWTRAEQWVWVLRFVVDITETPRMLAQAGRDRGSFRTLSNGRQQYVQGTEDAESDRGYTAVDSLSLRDEGRALDDPAWERHVGGTAREREARRRAMIAQTRTEQPADKRANAARAAARLKCLDLSSEFRMYERLKAHGQDERALKTLELIEARVFPLRNAA